ncbi:chaperonin CPN60-2, mitochondrial isoform X2 [Selaginella moellendorffii]|uniref:chaperonin CPN60-2, mitochondrial isoform X2 n=1 Tax=Selaginella moellendorffii TaxID=88036 RepID=UPI000D1CAE65|nr:chaperonin CPN60-2, mitochondrial isoform X2 [Selaginella moellendorffii]|eukprot:XP_024528051.1 chaperonin CPN60-2, mitochondrial isoform X2 [Selaginella moellendorffii]
MDLSPRTPSMVWRRDYLCFKVSSSSRIVSKSQWVQRNVIIEQDKYGPPRVTKDGVTVAKAIGFKDKMKNVGADLVKRVAISTNDAAGDGTTLATVLTRAIFTEGCKLVAAGMNAMELRRGINLAVDHVVFHLKNRAKMISTSEEISQVATVSANGDKEIGDLVAKAMERVGKEGLITIWDGQKLHNELTVVEGMEIDKGYISPYFVTNAKTQKAEFEDALILLHPDKISSAQKLAPVLEIIKKLQRPLLIIAEDVEGEALASLVVNKMRGGLKVAAIRSPAYGENRRNTLEDIGILTGAQLITNEMGLKLEDVRVDMLGTAKQVTIAQEDTIILNGGGDKAAIEERCEQIRLEIPVAISKYDREKLEERLGKLSGGVAMLKVGGGSEAEVMEKKDRVMDALNATNAAIEEGIVPGGGVALLYAANELKNLSVPSFDQKIGVQVIQNALKIPTHTIAANAGVEGALVVSKLLEQSSPNFGYDAATGEYVDMIKAGIIDPVKVIRIALMDAASISSLLTTTEVVITEVFREEREAMRAGMEAPQGIGDIAQYL